MADDLASLALDLLVSEAGYHRASGNPLLWHARTRVAGHPRETLIYPRRQSVEDAASCVIPCRPVEAPLTDLRMRARQIFRPSIAC